jgi:hypothetical protein
VPGVVIALRNYAIHVISISFSRVAKKTFALAVNLAGSELDALVR